MTPARSQAPVRPNVTFPTSDNIHPITLSGRDDHKVALRAGG